MRVPGRTSLVVPSSLVSTLLLLTLTARAQPGWALDRVRTETRADAAAQQFGVSGRGVLVAIMDRGLDWTNNDFRNESGSTRVDSAFDLTDDSGAREAANSYHVGTLYTRSQIDAALQNGTRLAYRDASGSGTAVTGIACGNGRNSGGKYRGIAPNSTILSIKIVSDGTAAHNGQPAEAPFWDPKRVPVAIDYVVARARQLGLPCVMLLNLGSIGGPTDGSSALCRQIDTVTGRGIPGVVFVSGSGDDGGAPNHARDTLKTGQTATLRIQKGSPGALYFDLWYPETDRFAVALKTPAGSFGPYEPPSNPGAYDKQQTASFLYYQLGADRNFQGANDHQREIWIRLDGAPGEYDVQLTGRSVQSGRFDATLNPSNIRASGSKNRFLSPTVPGSIWDWATAANEICSNAYVIRTQWTDIDGKPRALTGQGSVGQLWPGSSVGPTFDGRLGIDVSVPGEVTVAPYSPTSAWATVRSNLIQDGGGLYGIAGPLSGSNPTLTGIIALMLEMNPKLDAPTVKRILQQTARSDAFTGPTPSPTWGYGKVDAMAALQEVKREMGG